MFLFYQKTKVGYNVISLNRKNNIMMKKNKIAVGILTVVLCVGFFSAFALTAFGACGKDGDCTLGCTPPDPDCVCQDVSGSAGLIPCGKSVNDPDTNPRNECAPCTPCSLILMGQLIIEFLVKIAAVLALIAITFAGLLYIFAAGSSGTIEKAKSMIKYTLLGFVLVFIAWAVIDSILITMGYIDPVGGEWHVIDC